MKIGVVSPIWMRIPPEKYGGTESVVYALTDGLVGKGHRVTLFAPKSTASLAATLFPTVEAPLIESGIGWNDQKAFNNHLQHYITAFQHVEDFDVLHIHLNKMHDNPALLLALHSKTPVLFTFHYPAPTPTYRPEKYIIQSLFPHFPYTSISNAARSGQQWNFIKTVYNAVDIKQFPFSNSTDDYFAWLGKILQIKGLKESIQVALKAGVQLKIMGAIDTNLPESVAYFENEVKPLIDGKQIIFLGEADLKMKTEVFGKAKAFINALQWPEPFGLVMAEAQAVGTPVIALNKGAAGELIVHGKTGFVVDTLEEMVTKVKEVDSLKREDCRAHVEANFSPEAMIAGYEEAYTTTVANWEEYRTKQLVSLNLG